MDAPHWDRGSTLAEHLTGPEREALADEATRLARIKAPDRDVAAVTLQGRDRVIAWTISSWGEVDENHPATGKTETVTLEGYGFSWHRDRRQQAVAGRCTPIRQHNWDRLGGQHPWEAAWGQVVSVLRVNTDLVRRAEASHARYQAVVGRGRKIRDAAHEAYRTAETIWNERQEKEAHKAFLAEYEEPSLWEGHRKTLKLPPMPAPPDQTLGSTRLLDTSWFTALTALIEAGEDVADYTLGQALESQGVTGIPAALHTLPLHRTQ
ncbi:hypothetical protein [Streptomyces sp900116325]|uniref:hypothetical protein n=1 Tax=Streptomyces sp. 900116325 TaxID=3154295 RepID=UPI00332D1A3B